MLKSRGIEPVEDRSFNIMRENYYLVSITELGKYIWKSTRCGFNRNARRLGPVISSLNGPKDEMIANRINEARASMKSGNTSQVIKSSTVSVMSKNEQQTKQFINDVSGYYDGWANKCADFLQREFDGIIKNCEQIVEMGAHQGGLISKIHNRFSHLDVTCEEGRSGNVAIGKRKHLQFDWQLIDYETCDESSLPKADIVIFRSVLGHLSPDVSERIFRVACKRANVMTLIECEVMDSDDDTHKIVAERFDSHDQGMVARVLKPSARWIENRLDEMNLSYMRHDDRSLNDPGVSVTRYRCGRKFHGHAYDWSVANSNGFGPGMRRLWIVAPHDASIL